MNKNNGLMMPLTEGRERSEGERSEPERSGRPSVSGSTPNPEVVEQAQRRRFSAAYKLKIVREADACSQPGEIGALLRREGLYSSHLNKWRRLVGQGQLDALRDDKRGRKPTRNPLQDEVDALRRRNATLERKLAQAETIIEVQKKLSDLLGIPLDPPMATDAPREIR